MEQEYIYGVARIRALEGSLFTDETINHLATTCTAGEPAIHPCVSARIMMRLWIS